MQRPIHFEIHVEDPEASVAFFSDVLGWRSDRWGDMPYWLQRTGEGPGIDGAIGSVQEHGQKVVITMDVDDLDAASERVVAAGGAITLERTAIPGVGWLIYATDPNGLSFGLLESDSSATA
jgi:predicted enzyme related to lactoylglutathione lyase